MQKILLVGNGSVPANQPKQAYDHIIALDGGIHYCERYSLKVTQWLGDGDSSTANDHFLQIANQDATDLDKGIQWVQTHIPAPYQIDLLGVTSGERLDHTLAAIQQLQCRPEIHQVITPSQTIQLIRHQLTLITTIGDIISLVSCDSTPAIVAIEGCQWNGNAVSLETISGISNRATATRVTIQVHNGTVLLIHTPQL